jgi:hypothetical protein
MFEEFEKEEEKEEKESRMRLMRDSALVIAGLVILGGLAYFVWRPSAKPAPTAQATAQTVPAEPPNATRDLEIVKAVMGKDVSGIRVMWSVRIRNKSTRYTYSNIKYEASFIGPDGRTLSASADTIRDSIEPGGLKTIPEFVDGLYNSNASTYNFKLVGADASVQ